MTTEPTPPVGNEPAIVDPGPHASSLERGLRIRRLRLLGPAEPNTVDFVDDDGDLWPLSVIAGRTNTGKTSVLRFIEYVLGAKDFPTHREVLRQVRTAALEIETPDGIFTLERALESNRVHVYPGTANDMDPLEATALIVQPPSDPGSVSQFALSTVGLQDTELREAPTKDASGTDRMSFRDLMWVCLYLNERVGSQQLLHTGNPPKMLKLRQVVDAVFGVHDNQQADLARRVRDASTALEVQRRSLEQLSEFVTQQQPKPATQLTIEADELDSDLRTVDDQIQALEARERAASDFASDMREFHGALSARATASGARVRDRVSQLDRFGSLRAQYADDIRKLTMLVEAETLFDQLSVLVCPVCFSDLKVPPRLENGVCSLCHTDISAARTDDPAAGTPPDRGAQAQNSAPGERDRDGDDDAADAAVVETAKNELRAAKRRYKELDEYWQRLGAELAGLRATSDRDAQAEADASRRLDEATKDALSPFLAERAELDTRRQAILVLRSQVTQGLKLHTGLDARQLAYTRAERHLQALRKQQRETKQRPDRDRVVRDFSQRYAEILRQIQFPKVDEDTSLPPYIDNQLVPHVRGQHFKESSSGGQVLVSLAWMLGLFEIAYERGAAHPGVLMIDTPQKNLGGKADTEEFADIHLVERVYEHVIEWLAGPGAGAQVVIVDNTPPGNAVDHVRVEYTRDPARPPFGLIVNEVGAGVEEGTDEESADVEDEDAAAEAGTTHGEDHRVPQGEDPGA